MTHDPLCAMWSKVVAGDLCDCDLIAKVRQDEQKGIIGSVELAAIGQANQQAYREGQRDMLAKCIAALPHDTHCLDTWYDDKASECFCESAACDRALRALEEKP